MHPDPAAAPSGRRLNSTRGMTAPRAPATRMWTPLRLRIGPSVMHVTDGSMMGALGSIVGVMAPTSSRATAAGNALCVRPGPMMTWMVTPNPMWLGMTASSES